MVDDVYIIIFLRLFSIPTEHGVAPRSIPQVGRGQEHGSDESIWADQKKLAIIHGNGLND